MAPIKQSRRKINSNKSTCSRVKGKGIVNTLINKLPFEAHLPTYQVSINIL